MSLTMVLHSPKICISILHNKITSRYIKISIKKQQTNAKAKQRKRLASQLCLKLTLSSMTKIYLQKRRLVVQLLSLSLLLLLFWGLCVFCLLVLEVPYFLTAILSLSKLHCTCMQGAESFLLCYTSFKYYKLNFLLYHRDICQLLSNNIQVLSLQRTQPVGKS